MKHIKIFIALIIAIILFTVFTVKNSVNSATNNYKFTNLVISAPSNALILSVRVSVNGGTDKFRKDNYDEPSNLITIQVPYNKTGVVEVLTRYTDGRTPQWLTWDPVNFSNPESNTVNWNSPTLEYPGSNSENKIPLIIVEDEHVLFLTGKNTKPIYFKYYFRDGRVGTIDDMTKLPFKNLIVEDSGQKLAFFYFDMYYNEPYAHPTDIIKYDLRVRQANNTEHTYTYIQSSNGVYVKQPHSKNIFTDYVIQFDSDYPGINPEGDLYYVCWGQYSKNYAYNEFPDIINSNSSSITMQYNGLHADLHYKLWLSGNNWFIFNQDNAGKPNLIIKDIERDNQNYKIQYCNLGKNKVSEKFTISIHSDLTKKTYSTNISQTIKPGKCKWTKNIKCELIGDKKCSFEHKVISNIDPLNTISETDENDNRLEKLFIGDSFINNLSR